MEKAKEKKKIGFPKFRKKEEKKSEPLVKLTGKDPYDILKFVSMTEKAVRMIEAQNKLVFVVDRKSNKADIRSAAQTAFNSKISGIKTMIDRKGRKKAFVKFEKPGEAGEIAIRLGII